MIIPASHRVLFTDGLFAGLTLVGFRIWERPGGRRVSLPARHYTVNGERRSFVLLRPVSDHSASHAIQDLILQAYSET